MNIGDWASASLNQYMFNQVVNLSRDVSDTDTMVGHRLDMECTDTGGDCSAHDNIYFTLYEEGSGNTAWAVELDQTLGAQVATLTVGNMGAAVTGTTPGASDNDTSLATSAFVTSSTTTFTNKTYDAGGTGNVHTHEDGTAPTVDVDGEIVVDETGDQIVYQSAAADFALDPKVCKSAVIEDLASTDDNFSMGMLPYAVTVTDVGVHCDGTCSTTLADIDLSDRAGNAMTHGAPTVSVTTGNTTFTSVTALNTLAAGEGIEFSVANTPTNDGVDTYTITFCYTVDRR